MLKTDILIIGSGLAGLTLALTLAEARNVTIVTKRGLPDGSRNWAQGDIAAVLDSHDSIQSQGDDTLIEGAG